jgi:hypothetical protein
MTDPKTERGEVAHIPNLHAVLKSQYHTALAMLRQAIDQCPDDLWLAASEHANPIWHIAYHTLFFTHLYLQKDHESLTPWRHARDGYQCFGPVPWPPHYTPKFDQPYTRAEVFEYWDICDRMLDSALDSLDLTARESGFPWYNPMGKLEHQFVNIRHIQHHTAQLIDRIRLADPNAEFRWVGGKPERT